MKKALLTLAALIVCYASFAIGAITGTGLLCIGAELTLSDTATGGTWTSSDPTKATIDPSTGLMTGVAAGSVTVTYTIGASYVTAPVTVSGLTGPAPITGNHVFCNGVWTDTLRDVTPGGTWSAGTSTTVAVSTIGDLTHIGTCGGGCGTSTITYTMPSGCITNFLVTVNPIVVMYTPAPCIGYSAMALGTPSGGTFTSSNPAVLTATPSGLLTGISAGSAMISYTYLGCVLPGSASTSAGITTHYVVDNPDTVCNGLTFHLGLCSSGMAYNIATSFGDGTSTSTSLPMGFTVADIHHTYDFPGTYNVSHKLFAGTTPMDSINYTIEHLYCQTLPVKIFNDNNHNCVMDAGDNYNYLPLEVEVDSNGVMVDLISTTSGLYYKAFGPIGTIYSFRIITPPSGMTVECPTSGVIYDTIHAYVNTYTTKYFAMNCSGTGGYDLAENGTARSGRHAYYADILISNTNCTLESPIVTMHSSPKYSFVSSYPTPTSVAGTVITWDLGALSSISPLPPHINAHFEAPGAWLLPGDTVQAAFGVTPIIGDGDTSNNNSTRVDTVKSSFDPNEMSVIPGGCIAAGQELEYTINFENTGNDTAHDIHVMDTLSDNVDPSTLHVVASSAVMNIARFKVGGHTIIKFDFPGINLPDSSHHNQCDGMVIFRIKARASLPVGTSVLNHAGIFFDDNEVVMTDTVQNTVCAGTLKLASHSGMQDIAVYPNPANEVLTIRMESVGYDTYAITNQVGQTLIENTLSGNTTQVGIASLPAGLYYITFKGNYGMKTQKFVKQ